MHWPCRSLDVTTIYRGGNEFALNYTTVECHARTDALGLPFIAPNGTMIVPEVGVLVPSCQIGNKPNCSWSSQGWIISKHSGIDLGPMQWPYEVIRVQTVNGYVSEMIPLLKPSFNFSLKTSTVGIARVFLLNDVSATEIYVLDVVHNVVDVIKEVSGILKCGSGLQYDLELDLGIGIGKKRCHSIGSIYIRWFGNDELMFRIEMDGTKLYFWQNNSSPILTLTDPLALKVKYVALTTIGIDRTWTLYLESRIWSLVGIRGTLKSPIIALNTSSKICVSFHAFMNSKSVSTINVYVRFLDGVSIHVGQVDSDLWKREKKWVLQRLEFDISEQNSSNLDVQILIEGLKGDPFSLVALHDLMGCNPDDKEEIALTRVSLDRGEPYICDVPAPNQEQKETKTCPDCMHDGECDRAIGKCICPPGFIGEFCEEGCGGNAFGKDCMGHCSGQKGGCSGLMLCVPVIGCNCASGFTGEHCNVECSKGKYGPNCSFQCGKCLPSSQCDIFTGVCHDGCLQGYFPPLCNTTYSYLMKPPVVTRIDPRKITYEITSTSENIAGVGEPRYFQAQIQEQGSSNWSSRTPSLFHQQAVKHVSVISRLQPGVDYRLRVVLIDNDGSYFDNDLIIPHTNVTTICEEALKPTYEIKANWKTRFEIETQWQYYPNVEEPCPLLHYRVYLREEWRQYLYCVTEETKVAIPNRSPDFRYAVQVQAVTSQGPSAISHSVIVRPVPGAPSRVLRLRSKQLNSTGIEVSWARPRHTSRNIKLYIVKYECLRYLACKAHINCSESYGQFKTERLTIRLLNLYSHAQYLIKIAAYTVEMGPWSSVKATTSFRAPEIAPKAANVPIIFRNVTSLKVTWQPPEDCKLFHGFPLYYYYMLFEKHQEIRLISDGNVSQPPLNFTSLQPYTAYILRVYLVVTGGLKNPNHKLEILIRTTGSGLSPIHDLVADSVTSTSVSVHWKYPEARRNFVDKYIVIFVCVRYLSCEKSVQECSNNGTLDTLQTKIVLTNLEPYARYEISVAAFNGDMSDFVTLKINTNSSRPEIAPREDPNYLPRSGNSWIAFRWLPPSKCHLIRGPLFGYCYRVVKEDIKKVFNFNDQLMSHTSPQDLLITRGLFANVSNLTPFTPFKVEIGILNDEDRRSCQMDFTYNFTIWTRSSEKMGFDQLVAYKKGKHYIGLRWRKKADHSDQSSFVNVKLETGHSKPIRQRLKSRVCSIWSEYSCLDIGGLEPNVTYNISLRYYNSLSSSNNIPQSLTVRTVEEASGPPSFIKLLKKSHDSVIIEWGHPNISNGHIRSFKIISEHVGSFRSSLCCEESKSAVIPAFNIENASYVVKITELKPASEYYVTVSATTILPGDPVSITIYTKPGVPKISRPPYVLRDTITDTTAEVMLYPTDDLNEGPIWVYFIMICGEEEIEEDEGEIDPVFAIVKTAVNRTGFIVLTLSEEELSGPREVSIGSGEEFLGIFGFITNQPLSPNTNYTVLQIVMLDYMGSRSFGLAESEPFITKP